MPYNIAKTISIIGCGWLGMPLALELQSRNYKVQGTVRVLSKIEKHKDLDINFYHLDLNPETESIPEIDSDFEKFNSNWEYVDQHLLRPSGYANVTIPYKQNRAVIFDSFLFHKSQPRKFKTGYENRRINLTFLYGDKQSRSKPDKMESEL